jgi:hypothetical protein
MAVGAAGPFIAGADLLQRVGSLFMRGSNACIVSPQGLSAAELMTASRPDVPTTTQKRTLPKQGGSFLAFSSLPRAT